MNQNTKNILITGALGFIGGHTAKAFSLAGYNVIGVDRNITIKESSKFVDELIIDDFTITPKIIKNIPVDAIIHIAGTSLVGPSVTDPGEYYENNVAKTNQMLEGLAKLNWNGKIIFSSSAATYGNNCEIPIKESSIGIPESPYGYSKKMCEVIIKDHTYAYKHKGIALRYFNACGCDNNGELGNVWDDTHLIPVILRNVLTNKSLTIFGNDFDTPDGTCIRDYLHVTDIASAHVSAVKLCDTFDNGTFKAYNLGTGKGYSNLEILNMISEITNESVNFNFGPRRFGDADKLIADPTAFKTDANWIPKYSDLENIIQTTYKWMKKHEMVS